MSVSVTVKRIFHKFCNLLLDIALSFVYNVSYILLPITKRVVTKILGDSEIEVNGSRKGDPQIIDDHFYCLFAKYSYIGLVDAYEEGYFECDDLVEMIYKLEIGKHYKMLCMHPSCSVSSLIDRYLLTLPMFTNFETAAAPYENPVLRGIAEDDEAILQSIGYWREANTLKEAEIAKLDLIARKLKLRKNMKVLDVGCGEGLLCRHLAENYGVQAFGVNISLGMTKRATRLCKGFNVSFKLADARTISGVYDRITMVGLIGHFGRADYRAIFEAAHKCLADDGILLLETYSINHTYAPTSDGTIKRMYGHDVAFSYYLDILKAIEGLFVIEDFQNIGKHGTRTYEAMIDNLNHNWHKVVNKFGLKMARKMKASTASYGAKLASRHMQCFHFVLSKNGLIDGYDAVV